MNSDSAPIWLGLSAIPVFFIIDIELGYEYIIIGIISVVVLFLIAYPLCCLADNHKEKLKIQKQRNSH